MGLDFSIYVKLKNKRTGDERDFELAYWRKCYGIRDMIVEVAMNDRVKHKDNFQDVDIICDPTVIHDINEHLIEELGNLNSSYWTDSIWTPFETREQTLHNLAAMLSFEDWLYGKCELDDISFEESPVGMLQNVEDYQVYLEVINSY